MSTDAQQQALPVCHLLGRAVLVGIATGAVMGAIFGSLGFPIVGTVFGAVAGGLVGVGAGLLEGLLLIVVSRVTSSWLALRVTGGALAAAIWLALVGGAGGFSGGVILLAILCAVLGAVLAPVAAFGTAPFDRSSVAGAPPLASMISRAVGYSSAVFAAVGAVVGLIIGLVGYPLTAPFALIEGAIFGGGSGALLGLVIAFGLICARQLQCRRCPRTT